MLPGHQPSGPTANPNRERLRRYAQLALNAFEDLETELAIEIACANLRDLLRCLGAEYAVPVLLIETDAIDRPN